MFIFQLGQPVVSFAAAVMMPLTPVAIHRLSALEQEEFYIFTKFSNTSIILKNSFIIL